MRRTSFLIFFLALALAAQADDVTTVTIGASAIKLPNPPGMTELPKGDAYQPTFDALVPPGSIALKESIAPDLLGNRDASNKAPVFMAAAFIPSASANVTQTDAAFHSMVQKVNQKFSNGAVIDDKDSSHYEEIKKKVADLTKANNEAIQGGPAVCLGPIMQGDHALTLLFARNYTIQTPGQAALPQQSYFTMTYLYVNQKIFLVMIVRSNNTLSDQDLDLLKDTTQKYTASVLDLNKA